MRVTKPIVEEVLAIGALLAVVTFLFSIPSWAHDPNRPDLNAWFNKLASKQGICCSNSDATVLLDEQWESKDGHYRVKLYGDWIDVPDNAVIKEPNLDGHTLVWPIKEFSGYRVRCFIPGVMM